MATTWMMLPAEIHDKIYDITARMNAIDVDIHRMKTEKLINQLLTCANFTMGIEDRHNLTPSLIATCRPTNCWRCMNSATLCLQCEVQAQWGWGWNDWNDDRIPAQNMG